MFLIVMIGTAYGIVGPAEAALAASVCALLCWAAGWRVLAGHAASLDAAVDRLARAAHGDLQSAVPAEVGVGVPALAEAMERLFGQLHDNMEHVQQLAMYDPVTALPNRTNFRRACEHLIAGQLPGGASALFFIDLDRFKAVNDTLGHATGDVLLGMVANRLRAVADRHGAKAGAPLPLIGRLAGDEFTMFFAGLSAGEAEQIGGALLSALAEPFDLPDQEVRIGASIGIAIRPDHGTTLTDLMRAADAAMYHAKARGRGGAERYTPALADEIEGRARLESDLRDAVDKRQFALVFQPQVSAADGRIVGAEALLRWQHPDGVKLPGAFIQRAEDTGLIVEIGEWVVTSVAATISRWAALGVEQRMAVNISPRQIDHAQFFRRLRAAMRAAGAPARLLELEITETLAMRCSDDVIAAIAAIRADGASIAIDDFGTGYSNLARLRDLPIDRVKLDRSLTAQVAVSHEARTIAQAVISLIHGLNCEVVAEGIEDAAQAEMLRIIGCDVLQGYAVGMPMDEHSFLEWARAPRRPLLVSRAIGG